MAKTRTSQPDEEAEFEEHQTVAASRHTTIMLISSAVLTAIVIGLTVMYGERVTGFHCQVVTDKANDMKVMRDAIVAESLVADSDGDCTRVVTRECEFHLCAEEWHLRPENTRLAPVAYPAKTARYVTRFMQKCILNCGKGCPTSAKEDQPEPLCHEAATIPRFAYICWDEERQLRYAKFGACNLTASEAGQLSAAMEQRYLCEPPRLV